jgi:hypothetical protein
VGLFSTFLHVCTIGLATQQTHKYKVEVKAFNPEWKFTLSFVLSEEMRTGFDKRPRSIFSSKNVTLRTATGFFTSERLDFPDLRAMTDVWNVDPSLTFFLLNGPPKAVETDSYVHAFPEKFTFQKQQFSIDAVIEPPIQIGPERWKMKQPFTLKADLPPRPVFWGWIDREYGPDGRPYFATVSLVDGNNNRVVVDLQRAPSQ